MFAPYCQRQGGNSAAVGVGACIILLLKHGGEFPKPTRVPGIYCNTLVIVRWVLFKPLFKGIGAVVFNTVTPELCNL